MLRKRHSYDVDELAKDVVVFLGWRQDGQATCPVIRTDEDVVNGKEL